MLEYLDEGMKVFHDQIREGGRWDEQGQER
jgi:hypothetical protein